LNNPGVFSNKKILVTGAGGYLAGQLIPSLIDRGAYVRCLSRREKNAALSESVQWLQGDIKNPEIWTDILQDIDIVFHLAAQTSARIADENPDEDFKLNVQPVLDLIACKERPAGLAVIFAATATQCGITRRIPVDEKVPDQPLTSYDRHKLAAETALLEAARRGELKAISLRLCNIYGPGKTSSAKDRGILNQMAARAVQGEPLSLVQEAENFKRDYLFIEDAVSAFVAAASNVDALSGGYYIIGSGQAHTVGEAFEKVASIASKNFQKEIPVDRISRKLSAIDQRHFAADSSLFRSKTGWSPRYSLDRGIEIMIEEMSCVS
jgi:UDP-glucose 4-epimerase